MSLQLISSIVETFRVAGGRTAGRRMSPTLAVLQLSSGISHLTGGAAMAAAPLTSR